MNKKPFKDIEHIIKNAAEAYEQAFDEQAWQKMEVLLDKDKGKKRPSFLWWWLLPIAAGIVTVSYFILNKKDQSSKEQNIIAQKHKAAPALKIKANPDLVIISAADSNTSKFKSAATSTNIAADISTPKKYPLSSITAGKYFPYPSTNNLQTAQDVVTKKKKVSAQLNSKAMFFLNADNNTVFGDDTKKNLQALKTPEPVNIEKLHKKNITADSLTVKKQEVVKEDMLTSNKQDTLSQKTAADKKIKRKVSNFYFIASAGADANGVKLFYEQKITARGGLAIGYQFSQKLSVQTGFFIGSKKYFAGPADYKIKPGTYWSTLDITKINANCKVVEIPLLLRYDFTSAKKINYFLSSGFSSYIIKKEDYRYYYNRYGSPRNATASYKGNQHFLSVLRFSAGVEKKLLSQFSLSIAPAFAIPLAGVGEGQVKLYSTDVMIGLRYTPIRKNN